MWPVKKLGEVSLVERGTVVTKSMTVAGDVPVVAGGLEPAYFHNRANRPAGVVTVSASGANAGFVNWWDVPIFASDCTTVLPLAGIMNGRFTYYFLKSRQEFIQQELRRGAAQPHVYAKDLATIDVCVPPLDLQQQIVVKLDLFVASIQSLEAIVERRAELFANARMAVIDELLVPQSGWQTRPLAGWCEAISTGPFGSLVHKADYQDTGVPLVNPMNINDGRISDRGLRRVSSMKAKELERHKLAAGDIVLGRRGEMGRCAVIGTEHEGWICGTGSFALRPSSDCVPEILAMWLSSRRGRARLTEASSGTTMDNLGNRELGRLEVSLPDLVSQTKIVERGVAARDLAAEAERLNELRRYELANFRQSVLEAAFRGDL